MGNRSFIQPTPPKQTVNIGFEVGTNTPAKIKISEFPTITSLSGDTYIPVIGGTPTNDYKILSTDLLNLASSGLTQDVAQLKVDVDILQSDITGITSTTYTKTETNTLLDGKSDTGHTHSQYSTDIHSNITDLNLVSGTNTGDQDLSGLQTKIDTDLDTLSDTIVGAINEVRTIALGADIALVFDTKVALDAWLLISGNTSTLEIGNLLLIRELTVPDRWWDGTTDLELEVKIDLTNYYTSSQIDTLLLNKVDKVSGKELSTNDFTDELKEIYGNTASTGWAAPIGITAADSTHVNISAGEGHIMYNTGVNAHSPIVNEINYIGNNNVLITNLASADITYFLVNVSGVLYQQTTYPTPEQRRDNLFIGRVSHPNRTSILSIVNTPDFETSPMSQLRDMFEPIKMINSGITPYADGANLGFNISGGKLTGLGINADVNVKNPNQVSLSSKTPASFFYRTQLGGSTGLVSVIDPNNYDLNGVITSIPGNNNRSSNIRVYQFSNGNVVCQYGQKYYDSLSLAVAGIPTEQFIEFSNVDANAILIGIISVRRTATVLNSTTWSIFTPASMFGEVSNSTNGISVTDIQGVYNNSVSPEIITDDTRGALTLRDGTSSPTNNQFEIQNFNGVLKASINGKGSYESIADYGSNEAPLVYDASNWTLTSGWIFSGNSLDKNVSGTNEATALLGVAPIANQVYKLTFTVAASVNAGTFVGNVSPSFGGTLFNAITAVGTYTYYIHAVSTTKLSFGPSPNNSRFSITNISVVKKTDLTADLTVGGDVFFSGNRILNRNTNTPVFYWYPNGATYAAGAFTVNGAFNAGTTISASSSITGRQLCTTTGNAATTTGAVTMQLSSNSNYYLTADLTGTITVTTSNPAPGAKSHLFFTQGSTVQSVIFSQTGVTWRQTGTTNSGTNTITLQNISTVNAFYKVMLDWVNTSTCYITVM